ncbi:MAG TPA: glycosyltransferase family 1 protein [Acidimicrobiales bacterium]|nr:glycosyltransferase family 1 protein [Acidimicrobiales bacterium]
MTSAGSQGSQGSQGRLDSQGSQGRLDSQGSQGRLGSQGSQGRLVVALDATPLLTSRAGVGEFCWYALQHLGARPELRTAAFAISWRRRHGLRAQLPRGVELRDRPMPARPLHWSWSRWPFPPIEAFIGRADVVHGTNFVVPPARRAAMVVTVHDLTPVRFPELVERATLAYPELISQAVRRGAWVHTPTEFVAGEVVEVFGAAPERVRAVHHGVAPRQVSAAAAAEVVAGLLPGWVERYILFVGTVEPRKDLATLVRAFGTIGKRRPGLALVIAGREAWGRDRLDEAVAACSVPGQVVRLGRVADAARDALVARAELLAYPSLYEGFGLPPLEAMAAGTPVVASRVGALEEVLGDAARLFAVGDSDALASAMEELLDDRALRDDLVARGYRQAARYDWDVCAAGLAALYVEAAAGRR